LRERLEDLIEEYREKRMSDQEVIEELRDLLNEMRSRDREAEKKGLDSSTELSFYHAVEEVLGEGGEVGQDRLIELTRDVVGVVEEHASVVEWKRKVNIQKSMRKDVKLRLYGADADLSDEERDELTNRIIELARAHYGE